MEYLLSVTIQASSGGITNLSNSIVRDVTDGQSHKGLAFGLWGFGVLVCDFYSKIILFQPLGEKMRITRMDV